MSICYLDGHFLPLAEAKISVLDRGFIFGDGVYEVIPVFARRTFRLSEHLDRLERSLAAIGIDYPLSRAAWTEIVTRLVDANAGEDQSLYVQITRGVAARNHAAPSDLTPTVFAMSTPLAPEADPEPVKAVLLEDIRWQRCDIKATSLLANVLFRRHALQVGAYEAILIRDGVVTEGAASNVFIVHDGRIKTPPHSVYILPGITRDLLVEVLAGSSDAVLEGPVSRQDLLAADEVWLTSSSRELVPVAAIDDQRVGDGRPGATFKRVRNRYEAAKRGSGLS